MRKVIIMSQSSLERVLVSDKRKMAQIRVQRRRMEWSQSSLERVLVSDFGRLSTEHHLGGQCRNPLWSESWFPTDAIDVFVNSVKGVSQSSLERVLVSDVILLPRN